MGLTYVLIGTREIEFVLEGRDPDDSPFSELNLKQSERFTDTRAVPEINTKDDEQPQAPEIPLISSENQQSDLKSDDNPAGEDEPTDASTAPTISRQDRKFYEAEEPTDKKASEDQPQASDAEESNQQSEPSSVFLSF